MIRQGHTARSGSRVIPVMALAIGFVLGSWALSWLAAAWLIATPDHPSWSFDASDDIIVDATRGIRTRFTDGQLELAVEAPDAYIMLRLTRAVDTDFDVGLGLDLCAESALELGLGTGSAVFAIVPVEAGCHDLELPLTAAPERVFRGLRVHLFGDGPVRLRQAWMIGSGASVERLSLAGPPRDPGELARQLEALRVEPLAVELQVPARFRLAPVLAWRDAIQAVRPTASVSIDLGTDPPAPGTTRLLIGSAWLLLCLVPVVALYRSGPRSAHARRSAVLIGVVLVLAGAPMLVPDADWVARAGLAVTLALIVGLRWGPVREALTRPGVPRDWVATLVLLGGLGLLITITVGAIGFSATDLGRYLAWAVFQQVLLGPIFSREGMACSGGKISTVAVTAGLLFGALHLPNLELALLTGLLGAWWSVVYLRGRSVWPQAVAHAGLGSLAAGVPQSLLHSLETGVRFLQ